MGIQVEVEVTVNAPPDVVFAKTTDIDAFGEWMSNFVRVERLSEGPIGKGHKFREVRKMFGKEAAEVFEVTAWDPPKRFGLFVDGTQGASKKGEFDFTHTFEPVDGGKATRVVLSGDIRGMGCVGALFGWMMKAMFRKMIRKDFQALKAWIEGQPT